MWILREHRTIFRNLKIFQLLLTIILLSLEIIQIITHLYPTKLTNENVVNQGWIQSDGWNAQIKIWVFFVFLTTIIGLAFYIFNFKRFWSKGPFLWIDIILTTLWLTAALANLDPVFRNSNILQCGAYDSYNFHLMCQSWISSIVLSWINMILFIISFLVSCRIKQEKQKGLHSFNKPPISTKQKKMTSNRQSVLLKQTLDNPDKPQPVMLETGFKPLMLPIMVDNDINQSDDGNNDGNNDKSRRNSMIEKSNSSKRFSILNGVSKKRFSMIV